MMEKLVDRRSDLTGRPDHLGGIWMVLMTTGEVSF
jgi:hypothetical protein